MVLLGKIPTDADDLFWDFLGEIYDGIFIYIYIYIRGVTMDYYKGFK